MAITIDNRDDRTQILDCLNAMPAKQRVAFLGWCCKAASNQMIQHQVSPATTGEVNEIFGDIAMLMLQHNLKEEVVLKELERRARMF